MDRLIFPVRRQVQVTKSNKGSRKLKSTHFFPIMLLWNEKAETLTGYTNFEAIYGDEF